MKATKRRREYTRQFYDKNKIMFAATLISNICMAFFSLIISWLIQQILDAATGNSMESLWRTALIGGISTVLFALNFLLCREVKSRFQQRAMRQYKAYAFEKLTRKSIGSFSKENTASYISALTNDAASVETNYLMPTFTLAEMSITFIGALIMMVYYSPVLTAIAIGLSLLPVVVSILTGGRLAKQEQVISEKNETFVAMVKDLLSGFSVIKSFKAEAQIQRLFDRKNEETEAAKCERHRTEQLINMFASVAGVIAQMGVFWFGAWLAVTDGSITPGVVIVFVQLMNYVLNPIGQIPLLLANRKAAIGLIDKLAAMVEENVRSDGEMIEPVLKQGITVENLRFGYEEGNPVLDGVNLTLEAGKSYAIVGESGSGKSTLLNLLMGSCETYEGEIRFDSKELRQIHSDSLYELMTLVQQNVFVFNDTIRRNVTMFRDFDDGKVADAIRRSGLASLIAERGEDYVCGENGSGLSGGEKQRISIARALLQGAPVMLVDEATAALDAATAFEVTKSILDIEGLTRIVVTHRLEEALLRRYDQILVLKGGIVCEQGSFVELMERQGLFYSLFCVAQEPAPLKKS